MIIDRHQLAGDEAYLRDGGAINLADSATRTGRTAPVPEGVSVNVSGVRLLLQHEDLLSLYPRTGAGGPLLSFTVIKEMFPGLFDDPYANRVHTVGGHEDFQRGQMRGMRSMEVEGKATLVSMGAGDCAWESPLYVLTAPTPFHRAAWELATSRLSAPGSSTPAFQYSLLLEVWTQGQVPGGPGGTEILLSGDPGKPEDVRSKDDLGLRDVIAYRVRFKARINTESALRETDFLAATAESYGRPLLRAVHLLEPVQSDFVMRCLSELEAHSADVSFLNPVEPVRTLMADVSLSAVLVEGEEIRLEVRGGTFKVAEARLDAEVRLRPPKTDREMGAS